MKMTAIIIDDEQGAIDILGSMLKKYSDRIEIIETANGVESAYKAIQKTKPDMIFLDIEMKDGTGFDLLKKFDEIDFKVVFTTAFNQYAINAFRMNAVDYILKPIVETELEEAIQKVELAIFRNEPFGSIDKIMETYFNKTTKSKKLAIKESSAINYVDIDDIVHLKADGNYTTIILNSGKHFVSSKVLKHFDALLSGYGFLRVHRSNMINLNYVKEFRHRYGGSIVLKNNDEVSVAPDKKKMFLETFGM